MNKNTIIYVAVAISVLFAGFILFSGHEDFETKYTSLKTSGQLEKTVQKEKDVTIQYQTSAKEDKSNNQNKKQAQKEKFVESKALDSSKQFEIALLNEQTWDPSKTAASIIKISGTIDNSPFFMVVPSYLAGNTSDLKLRITNTQTGEVKTMFAPFLKDLSVAGTSNTLTINSSDMNNYSFEQKQGILPQSETPPALPSN